VKKSDIKFGGTYYGTTLGVHLTVTELGHGKVTYITTAAPKHRQGIVGKGGEIDLSEFCERVTSEVPAKFLTHNLEKLH
jgi:hypothetical protein